jgi:hypothetical protein
MATYRDATAPYFFVPIPRRGESYRVTVLSFDRLEMGGP